MPDTTKFIPPEVAKLEGGVARDAYRKRYIGKSVASYFARHSQNPIKYVNC